MAAVTRRGLLAGLGTGAAGVLGLRFGLAPLLSARPVRALEELSDGARALAATALAGLAPERLLDLHVHVLGLGGDASGCWVNPRLTSHLRPLERLRFELYLSAAGVQENEHADRLYAERLAALLAAGPPGLRLLLLAFDLRVDEHGREDLAGSMFRVPDEHVCALARAQPRFLACASVHPYRTDALARLERAHALGAVAVKWLPNAMGIDPAAPRCAPFYAKLVELGLPLLVHSGEERAVWADEAQDLGNPLRLRAPLAAGVRVVALHCGSLGAARDLDRRDGRSRPAFELFLRLLDEHGPAGNLFGELSAVTQVNRDAHVLRTLLARPALHARLLNGSDYPLVAIDPLTHLGGLAGQGLLAFAERAALRELFEANPLVFDLVLKRRLRRLDATGEMRFAPEVFESARLFDKL